MAIYAYKCTDCNVTVDITRGISEPESAYECSDCGSVLFRVFQAPEVKFNGSGFYSTDK
jgi:putative FmdB family regulatory protein